MEALQKNNYFTFFKESIDSIPLPEKFTFPFNYQPHPLCIIASKELQQFIQHQNHWNHNFGLSDPSFNSGIGKMFGVLIVKNKDNKIGYLSAFSGKLAGTNHLPGFVPPVYDILNKDGFFKIEEDSISELNQQIKRLETSITFRKLKTKQQLDFNTSQKEISAYKAFMKNEKQIRDKKRLIESTTLSKTDFEIQKQELIRESQTQKRELKQLRYNWQIQNEINNENIECYAKQIEQLKTERKQRSAALQQRLFDQYHFLNKDGISIGVNSIFVETAQKTPPASTGDCAAPKLLQYAFQHQLHPIAMAEFWWGKSPKSEIRKHGHYYPACQGKCKPILGHMLSGIEMDNDPMQVERNKTFHLDIKYEDDQIIIINKPTGVLSVPGKEIKESIYTQIKRKYPSATGPLLVHRLDMATSGLLLIAKNKEAHKILQSQFIQRTIQKRYVALLDGIIKGDEGIIDLPLRVDLDDRPRQIVCYDFGKPARTKWKVLERRNGQTRIHFFPITGRTHQLRVHAAHLEGLNSPIVGDELYGVKNKRLHLHAEYLEFKHPTTHSRISIKASPEF